MKFWQRIELDFEEKSLKTFHPNIQILTLDISDRTKRYLDQKIKKEDLHCKPSFLFS